MDCQHVQQLLAFVERKSVELDAPERAAVQQHLANCPACTAFLQTERRADEAVGTVMRDVTVPADLQQKVRKRLALERSGFPWKRASAAIAAVLLVALGLAWYLRPLPEVNRADVLKVVELSTDKKEIEKSFLAHGLTVAIPEKFNYQYLQHAEVVKFKGRWVAKLTLSRADDGMAIASVFVLSPKQFRLSELQKDEDLPHSTSIQIRHERHRVGGEDVEFTYLIYYRGRLELLQYGINQ